MNKLQGKDLVNIGIFTAIYFVVIMIAASLGYIPIFIPLLSVIVPLVGGIPMMLFYSKIKKFGMITIIGFLVGLLMLVAGMGYWSIITGLVFGLIADLLLKKGEYRSSKLAILSYGVFSMWVIGNFIPIIVTRASYYEYLLSGFSKEYADSLMSYMPNWILPVLLIASFVFGILGAFLGKKMFKKHFKRAGIV